MVVRPGPSREQRSDVPGALGALAGPAASRGSPEARSRRRRCRCVARAAGRERKRLLPMDERDHTRAARGRDPGERVAALRSRQLALNHRLQRREDEEDPEEAEGVCWLPLPRVLVDDTSLHPARNGHNLTGEVAGELVRGEDHNLAGDVSGKATLRRAIVRVTRRTRSGSVRVERVIGDSVQPGQTALTRPSGAIRTISFFRLSRKPWARADLAAA